MHISVLEGNWNQLNHSDIESLLKNIASHINKELKNPFTGTIHVKRATPPKTFLRKTKDDPIVIQLDIEKFWEERLPCQATYQFAHEFCHAISNYEMLYNEKSGWKKISWFHEAICITASIFTLRCMAKEQNNASLPSEKEWQCYEKDIRNGHKEARIEKYGKDIKLCYLLESEDTILRKEDEVQDHFQQNQYLYTDYASYSLVANALLPIFVDSPSGWGAVQKLPASDSHIMNYFDEWWSLVDEDQKQFVECCKKSILKEAKQN